MCNRNPQNRDFKGVWIPKKLYFDQSLTWTERILLTEIDSLDNGDGCYASNTYLAEFMQISRDWLKHLISNLKSRGLIVIIEKDGRRYIKLADPSSRIKNGHDDSQDDGEMEVPPGAEINLTADQNAEVSTVYDFWNSYKSMGNGHWHEHTKMSYSIRLAVSNAMRDHSVENICSAIANYASVLQSDDHYWTYEWTLNGFLSSERSGGERKWLDFLPGNFDESSYRGQKPKQKPEKDTVTVPNDDHPGITESLVRMFRNMTNSQRFEPNNKQKAQLIEASIMMVEFFKPFPEVNKSEGFKILRRALEKKYIEAGETLNVGNLCSKYTWDTLVPQLMRELGHIE